uniref:Cytochrome b n=1 Tax=Oreohelix idahoensis TaxID=2584915 RepID=A0A4Y5P311_9EUPU|nr:cytochrome b [Oreohelix idahoensis]QCW57650.1 cytochrome b [Oreohelix idahoensis]
MQKTRPLTSITMLPTPISINMWWNIGSLLGMMLGIQIITGIFLSMYYEACVGCAFWSVIHITRDVSYGWIIRSLHANGASFYFLLLYFHMGRGLYYQSYLTQTKTWAVGVTIFLLSMITAFLGYVLPWGQMSYWGATVITNLLSALPYLGPYLVEWIWGGFAVGQSTLTRFFTFHFLLPFSIAFFVIIHILFLHKKGSSNPLGEMSHINKVPFHPYFTWKDMVGFSLVLSFLFYISMFYPNILIDPENFILANSMVTPVHIQPEWYFLFAYAILRAFPNKLGGVIALIMSVLIYYFIPFITFNMNIPTSMSMGYSFIFWSWVMVVCLLTWLGACPAEPPFIQVTFYLTIMYFIFPLMFINMNYFSFHLLSYFD